ncbi:hypothetical protein [Actinomadura atramentaria]|uniref:hypothetical protein n=1 Tax=Actinomadura atramentaria TaxID=1990 RepID=UPI0003765B80|nr:hypothetical protein [Actinomadura atramentaria]
MGEWKRGRQNFVGNVMGNVTINGQAVGPGVYAGGEQVACSCGNTTNWGDVKMTPAGTTAECGECGESVRQ